jgi:hypothetical protein
MSTKVSALTQATNAELASASLAYVVTDPSGTPASKKSTLARLGLPPASFLDEWQDWYGFATNSAGDYTTGNSFAPIRAGQSCTGIRVYWNDATATTLTLTLWASTGGSALASGTVASSSAGFKSVTFGSAVNLTKGSSYIAAVHDGLQQLPQLNAGGKPSAPAFTIGTRFRDYAILGWGYYASGNAFPGTAFVGIFYGAEPIISG